MKWEPIDTAPKDGTEILIAWNVGQRCGVDSYEMSVVWWAHGGWFDGESFWRADYWMPLPEPPP